MPPSEEENKKRAEELKEEGNAHFGEGNPEKAVHSYTKGLELDPTSHVLLSNRAAAYLKMNNLKEALKDAKACVKRAPEWPKGYTRLAQALYNLHMYDDCDQAIDTLESLEPTNHNVGRLRSLVKKKRVFLKLQGMWHGTVSAELGGYVQTFDFKSETEVEVAVFGKVILARLKLDCSVDPPHLDLLVEPEPDAPQAPEVKHIFKIDEDDTLHLCSPYMTPPEQRPTSFDGPAYVKMFRGPPPQDAGKKKLKSEISRLGEDEKCLRFAKSVTDILPSQRISPLETDSEAMQAQLMQLNIQFQTQYFEVRDLYGEEVEANLRGYLERSTPCPNADLTAAVDAMRAKMQQAGLFPSEEELKMMQAQMAAAAGGQAPAPAAAPAAAPKEAKTAAAEASKPKSAAKAATVTPGGAAEPAKAAAPAKAKVKSAAGADKSNTVLAVGLAAVAAAAIAVFALRRSSSSSSSN